MSLRVVLRVVHMWANKAPFSAIMDTLGIGSKPLSKMFLFFREAVSQEVKMNPPAIGGPGHIVEIDEVEVGTKKKRWYPSL